MVAGEHSVIDDYLAQEVWHQPRTGVDGYGQPTFAAATQIVGRWLEKRRLVRNAEGEQVISEISVTAGITPEIAVGDRLSADNMVYLEVIAISASRGLNGQIILRRAYL